MLEKQVIQALLHLDTWERFGGLLDSDYFESPVYAALFKQVQSLWVSDVETPMLDEETLKAWITATTSDADEELKLKKAAAKLYDGLDQLPDGFLESLVSELVLRHRAREYLVDAAQQLERGELDPSHVSYLFGELARAVEIQQTPDTDPVADALTILTRETTGLCYPTGIDTLDDQLRGGLWTSELGVFIAPSFRGKTWALCHLGATALRSGRAVQHHTHEISADRATIRYYQSLLGRSRVDVLTNPESVYEQLTALDLPSWSVKDHAAGDTTTAIIRKEVGEFIAAGAEQPLILVDYLDLLKPQDRRLEGRHALTAITRELRSIAAEFDVGIWTATQANRPSWKSTHIRMSDVSEAIGKVETVDVVITMNQTPEEEMCGYMRFYIDKARERTVSSPEVPVKALREEQQFAEYVDLDATI